MLYRPTPRTLATILSEIGARMAAHVADSARKRANLRYLESLSPHLQNDLGIHRSARGYRSFN